MHTEADEDYGDANHGLRVPWESLRASDGSASILQSFTPLFLRELKLHSSRQNDHLFQKNIDEKRVCHTVYGMKMTMHIDETLVAEVMHTFGCESKTAAVDFALREILRKRKLRGYRAGLGLSADELENAVMPGYDPLSLRVAESIAPYGNPPPSR